jgi:hypothetical protein
MAARAEGYYWIKVAGEVSHLVLDRDPDDWEVAYYSGDGKWSLCGSEVYMNETTDEGFGRVVEVWNHIEPPPEVD